MQVTTSTRQPDEPLPVGVHEDVPAERYHRMAALSQSLIKTAWESPRHFEYEMNLTPAEADEQHGSDAKDLGTLGHRIFVEQFSAEAGPMNPKTGKQFGEDSKAWEKAQAEAAPGTILLSTKNERIISQISEQIAQHPDLSKWIADCKHRETSFFWHDKRTGLLCKGRSDLYFPDAPDPVFVDVKFTKSVAEHDLATSVWRFGYDIQAAQLLNAELTINNKVGKFFFAFVQTTAPFIVKVREWCQPEIDLGVMRRRTCLNRIRKGMETGKWPGDLIDVTDRFQQVELRDWMHEEARNAA